MLSLAFASPSLTLRLLAPEASGHGPYIGLLPPGDLDPYAAPLFTRSTAQRIVDDLHSDACTLTASWEGEALRFTWSAAHDGDGGSNTVAPDAHGRYAIGAMWPWNEWSADTPHTAEQSAYALGAVQAFGAAGTTVPDGLAQLYARGRADAHRLTVLPLLSPVPAGCGEH
ncbi:hypothetical protein [Streptomyces sp. NPDC055912]|uniref:hypothetical protein n=1 Tax=Streptomyces sp. NPDC055912 TaxID=3345660 RepID=UPI0035D8F8C7